MNDNDVIELHDPIDFDVVSCEVVEVKKEKKKAGAKPGAPSIKPGFIAIFGNNYVEAKNKKELRKLIESGGHSDAVIIRGKIMPTAKITRLSF